MSIKTNKSYTKRFKVTKNGRILSRKAGQNHFNARENAKTGTNKRRMIPVNFMSNKAKSRFLATI
jgi:ribosomal protein L35